MTFVLRNAIVTRGHNVKLYTPQCNLNVNKFSFVYSVIDIWNSLWNDVDTANRSSAFKQKLEFAFHFRGIITSYNYVTAVICFIGRFAPN